MNKKFNTIREALYWEKRENNIVQCLLCPNVCKIQEGKSGECKVRLNENGILKIPFYGAVSSIAIDPIEKKPLYHFYPGEKILSFGTVGCSFHCIFCQNYSISQFTDIPLEFLKPEDLYSLVKKYNLKLIAFTYSEPLIWYEFLLDSAKYLKERDPDIKIVLVTNGYINLPPLKELLPYIDAANVDLKSFSDEFYAKYTNGKLQPVLNFIKYTFDKIHLEITNLVITDLNDTEDQIYDIAKFISSLSKDIPLHISRYYPAYKLNLPPTPEKTIFKFAKIASNYLNYVYVGNIYHEKNNTYCPECGAILIERIGYTIKIKNLKDNTCKVCGKKINIKLM